ncbi:cysteine synthase A [Sporolactobacillus laevolacticus]|uniref:Cysteine synthase n=1 Tax=Sporolactobacillus laevolacticus DSM 442 TaxID=1395513 RepID=V6J9X8_9BACL|nr:cysteine synthase A [Sporolactobacillus laevolacticus]EST13589.1 cysteine synthase [Sporolactobacillus laevolacticus DSM 442]MDN3955684.1 cysteine synthase A [Sporolactobacillus laevolacticus]
MDKIVQSIDDLVGKTPMVRLNRLPDPNGATIYVKLEYFNPTKSVKDRAALYMILEAERQGLLKPGSTIIEPTSGNMGIGLAMTAVARGYKAIIVMPDTMTQERINLLKAFGAEVFLTPGKDKMPGAIKKARELAQKLPNSYMPMQFENQANPDAHRKTTATEIIDDVHSLGRPLTAFVGAAGTGGTVTGAGTALKEVFPEMTVHICEPAGSPVYSGGKPGRHKIVGTSPGFIPKTMDLSIVDEIIEVSDEDAYEITRRLASEEGILCGPSSGASVFVALQVAKRFKPEQVVVCIINDTGERYLSGDIFPR